MNRNDIEKIYEGYRGISQDFDTMLPSNMSTAVQASPKLQIKSTIGIQEPTAASASTAGIRMAGTAGVPAGEMEEEVAGVVNKSVIFQKINDIIDETQQIHNDQIAHAVAYALNSLKEELT